MIGHESGGSMQLHPARVGKSRSPNRGPVSTSTFWAKVAAPNPQRP